MKNQTHPSSDSEALRRNARSIFCRRSGAWPGLLLAGCCAVLTGLASPTRAAVTEAWVHRYNNVFTNSSDQAVKVVRDAAGDVIVTGSTDGGITYQDMLTIKYSGADGSVLWQKRYNGPGNSDDQATALAVDGSGNVVVTGYSYNGAYQGYYTAKYAAADGALLWEQRYHDPANSDDQARARAVAVDGSGNVVVTGDSGGDYYTAKYAAADGTLLWEKRYDGPAKSADQAQAVAVDGSGNIVVTGFSGDGGGNEFTTNPHYYTAKYTAADGALLWEKRETNDEAKAFAIALDGSGNVVVTGTGGTFKYAAADGALLWPLRSTGFYALVVDGSGNVVATGGGYTAKYAVADGALLWEQQYDGVSYAVALDGNGNVVVRGSSVGSGNSWDYYTAKYAAANGALLWEKHYNGPGSGEDYGRAVALDGSGNVVVTGSSWDNGSGDDYYTAKYAAADGALLWEQRFNGDPLNHVDFANAVAVDGSGNVLVTGYSKDENANEDYYTAKYAATNGALLWEKRYDVSSWFGDGAKAMAIDGSGNVIVTGSSGGDYYTAKYAAANGVVLWGKRIPSGRYSGDGANAVVVDGSGNVVVTGASQADFYTAKYAAADGAPLWEQRYNGPNTPPFSDDQARAMALDASGNVVVTGFSYGTNGYDYYTAKYAATNGTLLWEKRYNGPGNSHDWAQAVAVDKSGNVVVTGYSYGSASGIDYYTAKYAAPDGVLLWEKRYNGPANGDDHANAVAVDDSGNAVVTGYSNGSESRKDYYTAKYANADGALLWEQRYNGPVSGDDVAQAVAVDSSGNVVVTGSSVGSGSGWDYYTAKYAVDGALLWEKRYNGPAKGDDFVGGIGTDFGYSTRGLALGPNGMVVITGSSGGDYATVVYREVLPPISIELVSTGLRLSFTGTPGLSYKIERAPAVTGPWTTINTQAAPVSGILEYLAAPPLPGQAFYRTVQP